MIIYKPDSSRNLTIYMISFISLFEIINVVMPDSNLFFWIAASVAGVTSVNSNGIKTLSANGLSTFFVIGKPVSAIVSKVCLKILLPILFYASEFFITLY